MEAGALTDAGPFGVSSLCGEGALDQGAFERRDGGGQLAYRWLSQALPPSSSATGGKRSGRLSVARF